MFCCIVEADEGCGTWATGGKADLGRSQAEGETGGLGAIIIVEVDAAAPGAAIAVVEVDAAAPGAAIDIVEDDAAVLTVLTMPPVLTMAPVTALLLEVEAMTTLLAP